MGKKLNINETNFILNLSNSYVETRDRLKAKNQRLQELSKEIQGITEELNELRKSEGDFIEKIKKKYNIGDEDAKKLLIETLENKK